MPVLVGKVSGYGHIDAEVRRMRDFIRRVGCTTVSQPSIRQDGKEISVLIDFECQGAGKNGLVQAAFPTWAPAD